MRWCYLSAIIPPRFHTEHPNLPAIAPPTLSLAFGLNFADLYDRSGLLRLDGAFCDHLREISPELSERFAGARKDPVSLAGKAESELIVQLSPHLEDFLALLFGIREEVMALQARHNELAPLYSVKRLFVQRRAAHKVKAGDAEAVDPVSLEASLAKRFGEPFSELAYARHVATWLGDEVSNGEALDEAARYAAWALATPVGRQQHRKGILFKTPHKLDSLRLVPIHTEIRHSVPTHELPEAEWRHREGFALTDRGTDLAGALDQANYCIWCHEQGKDSCSRGLREKDPAAGFRKSPFGVSLAGCPLEEKISEFHMAKSRGQPLGALAIICVDNPLAAATGHRICNDCMKSCIYQKQEPVDIPQAETRTLKDVLELPWGFEIYSLLTRWNPLNLRRPLPYPPTGKRVLVAGMGPAGIGIAHHLMNDGHTVVGMDGLKIEPLDASLSGIDEFGRRTAFKPVRMLSEIAEPLEERTLAGFGGVAEYGITVRWDKNFLKVLRLLLERRNEFALFGGTRLGSTLTPDEAFALGFDHIALCAGAGRPTVLDLPNGLARGVRAASDFLMALQLTGASRPDSIANLQIRLPIVVIGGGLTAIDTATESLAYYVVQVEKFLVRYEALCEVLEESVVRQTWTDEDREIADDFLSHATALRKEHAAAAAESRPPRVAALIKSWGGVTIAYRRRLIDSPAYTLNHEEVHKALEEGISFSEGLTPISVAIDRYKHAESISFKADNGNVTLPAKAILVAAGTQPNTVLAREGFAEFQLDGKYFRACDEQGTPVKPAFANSKPSQADVLLHRRPDGRFISYFGDLHPSYFGNVVKAMGSAKQGYPLISRVLAGVPAASAVPDFAFFETLARDLRPVIHTVSRLTPKIVEIVIRAPAAARNFQPGQFYRLQNFERHALRANNTILAMEGLAFTGAWVDREAGLVSVIALEMGGSANLLSYLRPGTPIVLMGPTGAPTEIPNGETVILVGGGLGNAVLFSIGKALRDAGSKVIYFAGYKALQDRYRTEDIEAGADVVIWCCDEAPGFTPRRPQDRSFVGNIVQAMHAYATGTLGIQLVQFFECDRMIAIGSDRMMAAVAAARHGVLERSLKPGHVAIGSINSPMQCMMKEICAQCLQEHVDPATGERTYVFSCFNQDQALDSVDFSGLHQRLAQNSLQEKLTALWIARCLAQIPTAITPHV